MKKLPAPAVQVLPPERLEQRIYLIRGQKVIPDALLAELYDVETRALIQAVKRNPGRFPEDFMFRLTHDEAALLTSQSVISKPGRGGRRTPPYVFTDQGVAMLSSVLNSRRAIQMNILIIRAFVRMRELLASHKELAVRVTELERGQERHTSYITILADEIELLKLPPPSKKSKMGFPRAARAIAAG